MNEIEYERQVLAKYLPKRSAYRQAVEAEWRAEIEAAHHRFWAEHWAY